MNDSQVFSISMLLKSVFTLIYVSISAVAAYLSQSVTKTNHLWLMYVCVRDEFLIADYSFPVKSGQKCANKAKECNALKHKKVELTIKSQHNLFGSVPKRKCDFFTRPHSCLLEVHWLSNIHESQHLVFFGLQ